MIVGNEVSNLLYPKTFRPGLSSWDQFGTIRYHMRLITVSAPRLPSNVFWMAEHHLSPEKNVGKFTRLNSRSIGKIHYVILDPSHFPPTPQHRLKHRLFPSHKFKTEIKWRSLFASHSRSHDLHVLILLSY